MLPTARAIWTMGCWANREAAPRMPGFGEAGGCWAPASGWPHWKDAWRPGRGLEGPGVIQAALPWIWLPHCTWGIWGAAGAARDSLTAVARAPRALPFWAPSLIPVFIRPTAPVISFIHEVEGRGSVLTEAVVGLPWTEWTRPPQAPISR